MTAADERVGSCTVLIVGPYAPELEVVAQGFVAAGIRNSGVVEPHDAAIQARAHPPIAILLARQAAADFPQLLSLPLAPGGALLLWHPFNAPEDSILPLSAQRLVLADLALPLERLRLVALVRHLIARAADAGRGLHRQDDADSAPGPA